MKELLVGLVLTSSFSVLANSDADCKLFAQDNGLSKEFGVIRENGHSIGVTTPENEGIVAGLTQSGVDLLNNKGYQLVNDINGSSFVLNLNSSCNNYYRYTKFDGVTYKANCTDMQVNAKLNRVDDSGDLLEAIGNSDPFFFWKLADREVATLEALEQLPSCD